MPAKDVEVNELGVWLPGRLLNVSSMMCKRIEACLPLIQLRQCDKAEGGSICNLAAAIVEATVEVEVSVLEVFPSSQLTSLSVFSGCEFLTSRS
jgi:hypothetical protein